MLDRVQYLIDELDHLNYRDLLKLKAEIEEQLKTFAEVYRMVSFPLSGDGSTEPASSPEKRDRRWSDRLERGRS